MDLYAHIFLFLTSTMDWLIEKRYKRMLDSFNENFSKRFDDEVNVIKHKGELIRNLAAQSSRAELRATRLTVGGHAARCKDWAGGGCATSSGDAVFDAEN